MQDEGELTAMADQSDHEDEEDHGVIRPIEEESVQRIVAGQAVTDLASAVKELVDNALDAGSTGINIRLFNQGLDILEVSDDGSGVPAESRPLLAQAHATSKIRSFDDIYSTANSLGFRGEALFCLANLSDKLIVATRTEDEPMGQKMEFRHDGSLNEESIEPVPRKVGTTVAVVKLLNSLPVRRADMERRIVQHRSKLMRMMEGYAIFSVGVRINLMDVLGGKETVLLATAANNQKLEQNISSVLGSKFLATVLPIQIDLTPALDASSPKGDWKLEGFLSKAPSDQEKNGSKAGQQFFSINGRPVELPKIARTIGDVWRSLGAKKKFSCIITLTLPNQEYDVNLSPEKRQVLLTHEDALCDVIQAGVTEFWIKQTEGLFTPAASQPVASTPAPAPPATSNLKAAPPKINDMESLAKIQESNRKRALELHAKLPASHRLTRDEQEPHDMDDDSQCGDDHGEEHHPARQAYIRKYKEEQNEQRKLNASEESANCQYGEDHPAMQEKQAAPGESPRVRRRGGFVHDISTAKQFERPSSLDGNFRIPPGIEDPDADEDENEEEKNPEPDAKRQRTTLPTTVSDTSNMSMKDAAALAASFATDDEAEQCSSRRVTLPNTSAPNSETKVSDGDKLLWNKVTTRFNQMKTVNPEDDIDALVKTSVSRAPSSRNNSSTTGTNKRQAVIDLEQFAFRRPKRSSTAPETKTPQVPEPPSNSHGHSRLTVTQTAARPSRGELAASTEKSVSESTVKTPKTVRKPTQTPSPEESIDVSSLQDEVVWGDFSGTAKIIEMSRSHRRRIQELTRKIQHDPSSSTENTPGNLKGAKVSLSKNDFAGMEIIGQFNLGFIVAQTTSQDGSSSNLWILDQHACDERYNFERLSRETVMHEQKLIAPMPIELDPWEENLVMAHRDLFKKNGFHFSYSEDKPPRHRLSLTALPHSGARDGRKAVTYGPEDVSALCAILGAGSDSTGDDDDGSPSVHGGTGTDGSGMYGNNAVRRYARSASQVNGDNADKLLARLPKAIAMFASRACRGSVMIGTALSKKEMEKVVKRMDSLESPWVCAHGRPTLTHIKEIGSDLLEDERRESNHLSEPMFSLSQTQNDT